MITDYLALDIETTGLSPEKDRVIEIGAVKYAKDKEMEKFSCLIKIFQPLPPKITELTGITDEMLSGGCDEKMAITKFIWFAQDTPILLGHNISFDFSFIKVAASRYGLTFERQALDTLMFAKKLHPEFESRALSALCAHYGIIQEHAHRAVDDAVCAHKLYLALRREFPDYNGFVAQQLSYRQKKQEPMTARQKKYLCDLLNQHGMEYTKEMDSLTKSDASRMIDQLIFTRGRLQS